MNTQEILKARETDLHRRAVQESGKYVSGKGIVSTLTLWGNKACARLRRFDEPGNLIIDLGCGPGTYFGLIRRANFIGLDSTPEVLEIARSKVDIYKGRGRIVEGDISDMPLSSNSVDSAIASTVFEPLVSLDRALSETERVLKPGGELLLLLPCEGLLYRLGRRFTTQRYVERKVKVDYMEVVKTEHINRCSEVLKQAGKVFKFDRMVGIPFWVPVISISAFVAVRYTKQITS